jgi:hypothetical protein
LKKKKKYNSSLLGHDHPIPVRVKKYCLVLVRNAEQDKTKINQIKQIGASPAWLDGPG